MKILSGADWAKALRSGKYEQTTSVLARCLPEKKQEEGVLTQDPKLAVSFCCLGVASKVAGSNWLRYPTAIIGKDGEEIDPSVFWNMNDCVKFTFEEIADHVDELVDRVEFSE